jgi:FKBP-type peptidyl-prolyl cis-trans isomerase FkpA
VLLAGLVLLASGVVTRVKTKDGILAIEVNEPGADVFVDGDKVEVTWADGNRKAAIGVKPGERQVEIRKDGFAVAGKKIMFKDGLREIFKATLDPVEHGHRSNEDEKRRDQGTSRLEIAERGQDFPELPAGAYPRDVNASRKFTVTPSGLAYRILRKSDGRKPAAGDHVLADYKGWLSDGKQFDNSYQRGKPTELHLDKVIAGWKEGLQLVGVGGMIELVIPPDLGYEDRDIPEIPANSTLHFIVELREIKDPGASTAAKAESIIPFFNGKDLTGWNGLPGYWQVRDGAIVGAPANGVSAHTFLCSQKTYRDFELKFQVRRKNGVGNSGVQFRSTLKDPQKFTVVGPQLEIDSAEFRMPPGTALNEPDAKPAYEASRTVVSRLWKNNEFNEMHLLCVARHVTVRMSGVIVLDVDYPTMPDEGIIAWQLNGFRSPDEVTFKDIQFADLTRGDLRLAAGLAPAANEENEFKPLFNGKNLSGWKTHRSQPGKWAVKQGVLVGSGPGISHLYSQRQNFSDFHLRVEARINDGGNSGVWFRSSAGPEWPQDKPNWPLGFEAQINCSSKDRFKTGSLLYIPGKPLVDFPTSPVSPGQWFTLEVIAKGNHITVQVDGKTTADFTDDAQRSAKGGIALQDLGPGTVVEYRKVEIREIKR